MHVAKWQLFSAVACSMRRDQKNLIFALHYAESLQQEANKTVNASTAPPYSTYLSSCHFKKILFVYLVGI